MTSSAAASLVLWFMVTTPLASVTGVMFPPLSGNLNGCLKDTRSDSVNFMCFKRSTLCFTGGQRHAPVLRLIWV